MLSDSSLEEEIKDLRRNLGKDNFLYWPVCGSLVLEGLFAFLVVGWGGWWAVR